ncbi:MAG: hypothetical protein HYY25_13680 [Candidatus Wallbacteria bacterium]|nr:hypothetical protein [Candidatus Wallbacteria bacterium]
MRLDAAASTDPNGLPLTYSWRVAREPEPGVVTLLAPAAGRSDAVFSGALTAGAGSPMRAARAADSLPVVLVVLALGGPQQGQAHAPRKAPASPMRR